MVTDCIYSIDLTTNSNEILSISSDDFQNLYISNINDQGDEIPYTQNKNGLNANFFMVKILNDEYNNNLKYINRLYEKKDVIKLTVHFTNGLSQEFDLPKKRVVNDGILENKYQHVHYEENDLCIIISDKNIKFKENLFA